MEYNSNRCFGLHKNFISFIHHVVLFAMLHSSFVAPAQGILDAYINKEERTVGSFSNSYSAENVESAKDTLNNKEGKILTPLVKNTFIYNKANRVGSYSLSADLEEGIIGVSKDKPLDNPSDNLFKVNIGTLPVAGAKAYLSYEVFGVANHQSVARSINSRLSVGGNIVKKQEAWSFQKEEIDASWLKQGENNILFTIARGANYQYRIKNLSIVFEKAQGVSSVLVVQNQELVLSKDNKVYVKGFLRGNHPDAKIDVSGTFLQVSNGEFEGYITLNDEIKKNRFLLIKATEKNEFLGQELLFIDNLIEAESLFPLERKNTESVKLFKAGVADQLNTEGASIIVNDSTLVNDYEISITTLRNIDIAPMESGMINVTKGGGGYRFLPDGTKFQNPVTISLDYDKSLLPTGYSPNDIKTYFFDTQSKSWIAVQKDSIDSNKQSVLSRTTHFTDYVNGIIQAPDSPETSAFSATMMSDVKAADPSSEITLVSPPSASQKGDANVTYPIKIPAGRNGMQPQLAIQYTSDGGDSWLGQGWNLAIPAITLDTRWGTPLFDPANETELYSLNGEQLMYPGNYLPHRHQDGTGGTVTTVMQTRNGSGNKVFYPRKQGSFAKIERLGNSPATYYWKVTGTDGTIYWYGGKTAADVTAGATVIKDGKTPQNIVHWGLYMVEDVYGNTIKYSYFSGTITSAPASDQGILGGRYFEPSSINYTGNGTEAGNYQIDFIKESSVTRTDLVIDGKLGVKRVSPYRLRAIAVKYLPATSNPVIRSYTIGYEYGKLGKSRPQYITEAGTDNTVSYRHDFEYYNDITQDGIDVYFGAGVSKSICIEEVQTCPDTDNDGVCDAVDACPDVPGTVANNGCPEDVCFRVTFKYYPNQPAYIKINGVTSPTAFLLPQNGNQMASYISSVYGYNVSFNLLGTPPDYRFTLFFTGTGNIVLNSVATFFASDPNNYGGTSPFVSCLVNNKSGDVTTFGTPSDPDYSYSSFYNHIKNNFSIGYSGNIGGGNPNCPWLINFDFLMQGNIPSFLSAPSMLGSSRSESGSIGGYGGVGIGGNPVSKATTLGGQFTKGWDSGTGYVASVDINGDGLEDIVYRDSDDQLYYKKHVVVRTYDAQDKEIVTHTFEGRKLIQGIDNFQRSKGESSSYNFQVTFKAAAVGGFAGRDKSSSSSETDIYFTDANGDGLIDIVKNEVVYFNYLDNGVPRFEPDSWKTENLVITANPKNIDIPAEYFEKDINFPKHDIVKVWEAPANGTIKITNAIELTDTSKEAIVTVETKNGIDHCFQTEFATPTTISDSDYLYYVQFAEAFSYSTTTPHPVYSYKANNLTYNSQIINAPVNLYYSNGTTSGCQNNNPPHPLPLIYMEGVNYYTGIASSTYETVCESWMNSIFGNISGNQLLLNNCFPLSKMFNYNNPSGGISVTQFHGAEHELKFDNPVPGFTSMQFSRQTNCSSSNIITTSKNTNLTIRNEFVGLNVIVKVNGVAMPGSYNLHSNFNSFKSAFESLYPGSTVSKSGLDPGIITIEANTYLQSVTIQHGSTINSYTFNPCSENSTFRSGRTNDWQNVYPTEEERFIADLERKARGEYQDFEINKIPVVFVVTLDNNENLHDTYEYVVTEEASMWRDMNGNTIEDAYLLALLNEKLPSDIDWEYNNIQEKYKVLITDRRNATKEDAIAKLEEINQEQMELLNEIQSVNLSNCTYVPNNLCLLFGANMNAANSTINNVITKYSTACDPSQGNLYVRKGDKIYFRVHSVTNGNAKVNWNPKVEYITPGVGSVTDQNGETPNASQYSDGFILSGTSPVVFPGNGTAQISWPAFTVNNPSDDVYYEIYRKVLSGAEANYSNIPETLIYQAKCTAGTGSSVNAAVNLVTGTNIANIPVTGSTTSATTPTVTLFYFRVRSTSNVKWKDFQWRPKVVCVTSNTIKNENQTSEGTATFKDVKYPVPDYTIYKSFPCSSAYNQYVLVVGTGVKNIMPNLSGISFSGLKGQLHFVVKAAGSLIGRKTFTINNNSLTIDNSTPIVIASTVTNLEIGYYVDDSKLSDIEESLLARVSSSSVPLAIIRNNTTNALLSSVYKANVNLFQKPNQKFGAMYRQWGQFAYNPSGVTGATQTAYGPLIKEEKLLLTDENSQQIQNAANSAESQFQNINLETGSQAFITAMNQYEAANQQLINIPFIPLLPNRNLSPIEGYQEKWQGMHAENYASETASRAATMDQAYSGMDPAGQETVQEVLKTGAYGITRYSTGKGTNLSAGVNAGFQEAGVTVGVQGSKSIDGSSNLLTDYVDLNGDRYPDLVSTTSVQYTTKTGGLFAKKALLATYSNILADYVNSSWGIGASGSFYKGSKPTVPTPQPTSKRPAFSSFAGNNSTGISGNYSAGDSNTKKMWTDINGDGMADLLVRNSLTGVVTVTMNLGNATAPLITGTQTTWGSFKLAEGRSQAVGGGIGFNIFGGSIEAGASLNKSNNHTDFSLIDMNGDGLSDLVMSTDSGLKVRINRGGNFAAETTWSNYNLNNQYQMVTMSTNLGFTFALVIGIPFTNISLKPIDINTNGSPYSTATNNTKKNITDYDGDGFPDLLEETSPGTVMIRPSNIKRTDKLKSITNPLGGKFTVDYKVVTPSYDNPHAKWVMTDVMVEDGYDTTNDGFDTYKKKYQYDKPRYDRREREFYGFETVKALDYTMDTSGNPVTVYRRTETKYHNKSYFLNGLVIDNTVYKGAAATPVFSKTINTYAIRTLDASGYINLTGAAQAVTYDTGGREGRRSGVVLLTKTQQYLYELGTTPLTTETSFTYNKYGAVLEYVNLGAAGTADDYKTTIKYFDNIELLNMNMVAIPESIEVNAVTGNALLRRRSMKVELTKGQVTMMATKLNDTEDAITNFEYDIYGNIKKVTLPANETGQRMDYNYTYDSANNKYIVHTRDAFNYVSTSTYEPKFDKVLSTTDMTNNTMTYTYDKFGRLLTVLAPNELASSKPYTIKFEYYPIVANLPVGTCITTPEKFMPFAVTKHFDVQHPTNDIETITIMDGLARVVQVKKDIQMNVGTSASPTIEERMSVSGMIMYDEFGRAIRQYHPWHEAKQCSVNQLFNSTPTANYSVTTFDQLDRPLKIKDPDGGDTDFVYNLATDGLGAVAHMTRTTVSNTPNPTITEVYKDITGKVTSTKNVLTGTTSTNIWTKFAYNAVGDIMTYTDDANMITSYEYDLAGRKMSMTHPDTGKTRYVYDQSSNIIKLQTANMAADSSIPLPANRYIKYEYDYNRIKTIKYPSPGGTNIANVTYTYGSAGGGTTNNTGRLINQKDATGEQSFVYGKMGEIIKNTRKVICPNVPSRTFITQFEYDSWNRLLKLTYPDNEQVSYSYDLGGNLSSVETSIEPLVYVKRIDYDYFEQRTFIKYGNNTETAYTYTNKLRRLDKLVSKTATNQTFLNGQYTYDKIGNITKFENTAGPLITGKMGGTYTNTYMYDNLSRLTSSIGNYTGDASQAGNNNDYVATYNTAMEYNTTHGIVKKTQTHTKNTLTVAANTYLDNYTYIPDSHKLQKAVDANSTMEESFKYDLNGNITVRDKTGTDSRKLFWDENNRLRAVVDKKLMQHNIYDAAGERVLKGSANVEELYNNGMPVDGNITFKGYTMYPSGYIVVADKGNYTKHYYIGSQRMLSRIGTSGITTFKGVSTMAMEQSETTEAEGEPLDEDALRASQIADITDILLKAERGTPVFKEYEPEDEEEEVAADETNDNTEDTANLMMAPPVLGLYYYHPDHLGSSAYLTDASGQLYQFYLNLPFGETMAEQHSLTEDYETPYKFNGKELDTDTGYYYYGARYYEPRISVWLSVDPLMEKYPAHNPYVYCFQNPIKFIDPTGMEGEDTAGGGIDPPVRKRLQQLAQSQGVGLYDDPGNMGGELPELVINGTTTTTKKKVSNNNSATGAAVGVAVATVEGSASGATALRVLASLALRFSVVIGTASLAVGDTRVKDNDEIDVYLYRNMRTVGGLPELGYSLNSLGIRPKDVMPLSRGDIIGFNSNQGLSTTMGRGSIIISPAEVGFESTKTSLYRINIKNLPGFMLKPSPINPTYWRITPLINMSIDEFDRRIQSTAPLWERVK